MDISTELQKIKIEPDLSFFHTRLRALGIFFVCLAFHKDILNLIYSPEEISNESIPVYNEINKAFDNIKELQEYNKEVYSTIYNTVLEIVRVKINNEKLEKQEIISFQLKLRKNIDKMKLYLPSDMDIYAKWDVNIKLISDEVLSIIKELLEG